MRASDSEREGVAERLRHATAEGRLTADELEERLEALFGSRTYGELDALVADLPVDRAPARARSRFPIWAGALAAITLLLAILPHQVGVARQSAVAAAAAAHYRQFGTWPPVEPGHAFVLAAASAGAFMVLGVAALVFLLVILSRTSSDG